jgi:DNA-packaging protein gp3
LADTTQDQGPFKGGRPFKFTDPTELRRLIQNYFDSCDPHIETRVIEGGTNQRGETIWNKREIMTPQKPYTTSGLARALSTTRRTLLEYEDPEHYTDEVPEDVRQELINTIGDAKRRVEEFAESQLFEGNANGAKFNLTNNHGWIEKTVQEHPGGFFGQGGRLEVEIVNPEPTPDEPAQAEAKPDPEPGPTPSS